MVITLKLYCVGDAKNVQGDHSLIYFQHILTQVQLTRIFSFITTVFSQYITRCIRLGREWYGMCVLHVLLVACFSSVGGGRDGR